MSLYFEFRNHYVYITWSEYAGAGAGGGGGGGRGAGGGNGTGAGKGANNPPHAHLQCLQFNLHFIFSIKFPIRGDTWKHTWHLQGFGFKMSNGLKHLFSMGLNTVGKTVLHIFTGALMTGGNGFGLTITDLHEHKSLAHGSIPPLQKHAAPFIWKRWWKKKNVN